MVSLSQEEKKGASLHVEMGKELLQAWLQGSKEAEGVDQWIFLNNSPSRHVPATTLRQFFREEVYNLLSKDVRVRANIDRLLRSKFSWKDTVTWNPHDPLWEISLLTPLQFERLAFLAATLSLREVIAKIIDGSVVRKLRKEIGEDILEFGLLSGSLSKYSFPAISEAVLLPDDPIEAIKQRATMLIQNAFSNKEPGVQQRIASKFPGSFLVGIKVDPSPLAVATEEMLCKLWKETSSWL